MASRSSIVANLGNRPGCGQEDAPCQAEETDQGPQLINKQTMNSLKSFEGTSVKRSGATVQLLTLAGGQRPAVINNQRSSQVGVRASKKAEENRENMNF